MELRRSKPKVALAIEVDQREVRGLELQASRGILRITRCAQRALPALSASGGRPAGEERSTGEERAAGEEGVVSEVSEAGTAGDERAVDDQRVVAALKALAQELQPEGKEVYAALPRGLAVERILELPPLKDELLGAALVHEVERMIPWPLDSVHFGYQVLERGDRLEALVAVIRREVLAGYLRPFERAGLPLSGAGLTDLAMLNAYYETVGPRPDESRIVVGIRDTMADLAWTQKGRVRFSRDFPLEPLESVEDAAKDIAELLAAELGRSVAFVNTLPGASPVKGVWLTGRLSPSRNRNQLIGFLTKELGVPVRIWPGETFGVFSDVGNEIFAPAFMVCYGLALQALGRGIYNLNLNPAPAKRLGAGGTLAAQPFWLKAAVLSGMAILFAGAGLGIDTIAKQQQIREGRAQLARLAPRVAEARALQAEYRWLQEEFGLLEERNNGRRYLELLRELHRLMPEDGWVELLSLEGDKLLELRGKARSATRVMTLLQKSPYLKELKFAAPIMSVTENGASYEAFRISGKVVEPGKGSADAGKAGGEKASGEKAGGGRVWR